MSQPDASGPLPPKSKPPHTVVGIALMVLGLLILVPSGLCSGVFGAGALVSAILNPAEAGDAAGTLMMVLIVGGIPVAIGTGLTWLGNSLRKNPD